MSNVSYNSGDCDTYQNASWVVPSQLGQLSGVGVANAQFQNQFNQQMANVAMQPSLASYDASYDAWIEVPGWFTHKIRKLGSKLRLYCDFGSHWALFQHTRVMCRLMDADKSRFCWCEGCHVLYNLKKDAPRAGL